MLKTSLSKAVSVILPYSDHLLCFRMKSSRIWGSRMSTSRDSSNRLGEKLSQPRCSTSLTQWVNSTSSRGTHALSTEIQCILQTIITTWFHASRTVRTIISCPNSTCRSLCLIQGLISLKCTTLLTSMRSKAGRVPFVHLSITSRLLDSISLAHLNQPLKLVVRICQLSDRIVPLPMPAGAARSL